MSIKIDKSKRGWYEADTIERDVYYGRMLKRKNASRQSLEETKNKKVENVYLRRERAAERARQFQSPRYSDLKLWPTASGLQDDQALRL